MRPLCGLLLVLICIAPAYAAETRDYTYFLNELVNLDGLPLIQAGVKSALASSCGREWKYCLLYTSPSPRDRS